MMNKLHFSIAICLFVVGVFSNTSQAQIEQKKVLLNLSGNAQFHKGSGGNYIRSAVINSQAGYFIGKSIVGGLSMDYLIVSQSARVSSVNSKTRDRTIFIGPFLRLFLANIKSKVNFFIEPGFSLFGSIFESTQGSSVSGRSLNGRVIRISPGLVFFLNQNLALEIKYTHGQQRYEENIDDVTLRYITLGFNAYF